MSDQQVPAIEEQGPDPYIFMLPTPRAPVEGPLFRPRKEEGVSALTIGLIVAVVVIGLFAVAQWVWQRTSQAARAERAATMAPIPLPIPAPLPEPAPEPPGVRRCANALGEVTYSDEACPKGTREMHLPVAAEAPQALADPGGATLYRCKGAGQFWSIVHCQHRGAYVVGTHTVPANLSLADQITFAQKRQSPSRPARSAPNGVDMGPPAPLNAAQQKAEDCKRLDGQVAVLDAYARHALSPGERDRVRGERQGYRDQQFRLRCGR